MHTTRDELLRWASRRASRARRTWGRILVSALGFAMAYYLDPENGGARRRELQRRLRQVARSTGPVVPPDAGDPPPVFSPLWHGLRAMEPAAGAPGTVEAAAR